LNCEILMGWLVPPEIVQTTRVSRRQGQNGSIEYRMGSGEWISAPGAQRDDRNVCRLSVELLHKRLKSGCIDLDDLFAPANGRTHFYELEDGTLTSTALVASDPRNVHGCNREILRKRMARGVMDPETLFSPPKEDKRRVRK
jgi:hypothetical protein